MARKYANGKIDDDFIQQIINRLYDFCKNTETEEEEKYRQKEMNTFIKDSENKISKQLHKFTSQFWIGKFEKLLSKLCQRHYMFIPKVSN